MKSSTAGTLHRVLHGNAVTGDTDALRGEFHPRAKEFQRPPYTWSGDTHPDASQWAEELLEATVAGKKCRSLTLRSETLYKTWVPHKEMSDMPMPPPPPVPRQLREMLKDYPEHIKTLQDDLIRVASRKHPGVDPFDVAIWVLESALETFISEARDELQAAEASGDPVAIERAEAKELLMLHARGLHGLHDLKAYFQANKERFE